LELLILKWNIKDKRKGCIVSLSIGRKWPQFTREGVLEERVRVAGGNTIELG
jgi:hypothetical protein